MKRYSIGAALCALLLGASAFAQKKDSFETIVRARSESAPGQFNLSAEDAQNVAGGFGDALRAVDSAPSVSRPPLGSGALVVWGSAPADTRILYMGMELPALYHLGGQRGILPATFLQDFKLIPAAFASEYGRALGGLILLSPRAISAGFHGEVAADLLDASAALSGSLGSRVRIAAAGRYSYLDRVLTTLSRSDLGDFFPLPRYYDAQAQAQIRISAQSELRAMFLTSGDAMTRAHATGDASHAQRETWQRTFYRAGLQFDQRLQGGARIQVTPWLGVDRQDYVASFGTTPAAQSERDLRYGLRANYDTAMALRKLFLTLRLGIDLLGNVADLERSGTLTTPPREGDLTVFGQRAGFEVNADAWSVHTLDVALHATLALRFRWLRIEPGVRVSGTLIDTSRLLPRVGAAPPIGSREVSFALEPRLTMRLQPINAFAFIVAAGLHHQPPAAADLSAMFGNPTLGLARAVHGSLAAELTLREIVRIECALYLRWLDQLVARSPLATPQLARALTQDGSGRSYGGQLRLRIDGWHFRRGSLGGWVGYSLSRSERRDTPDGAWRLFAFDQTHGLQAALQARLFGVGIALRLRYATGLPRTPVIGSYYNALGDQYEPLFGPIYSARLPDFMQLDLRFDYVVHIGARFRIGVQLEIQNLTNRKNAEEIVYNPDFSNADYITGLPTLAVLGARFEF